MTIVFALTISVLLQFIAAVIVISLIRRTKYNISWVLISSAFLMITIRPGFTFGPTGVDAR